MCALQRPLDDPQQLRVRLEAEAVLGILAAVSAGQLELISSDVLKIENLRNPHADRRDFASEVIALATETFKID